MKKEAKKPQKKDKEIWTTKSFAGVIRTESGQKKLLIKSPRWYANELQKYREGEQVTLQIHNRKPKRTEAQNRYYWGVFLPLVSEETGEQSIDRLHALFSGMFLTEGVVEVLGHKTRMKRSTTELSKLEFSDYILKISAETGVEPPPTENYGLDKLGYNLEDKAAFEIYQNGFQNKKS